MTLADGARFNQAFDGLALALRLNTDREGGADQRAIYFEALGDLEVAAVTTAAGTLQRVARFFPTVSEWAAEAERVAQQTRAAAPVIVAHPQAAEIARISTARDRFVAHCRDQVDRADAVLDWSALAETVSRFPIRVPLAAHCPTCQDTGLEPRTCEPGATCGRPACLDRERAVAAGDTAPRHEYVTRCICWPTNPIHLARATALAESRTPRAAAGRRGGR